MRIVVQAPPRALRSGITFHRRYRYVTGVLMVRLGCGLVRLFSTPISRRPLVRSCYQAPPRSHWLSSGPWPRRPSRQQRTRQCDRGEAHTGYCPSPRLAPRGLVRCLCPPRQVVECAPAVPYLQVGVSEVNPVPRPSSSCQRKKNSCVHVAGFVPQASGLLSALA